MSDVDRTTRGEWALAVALGLVGLGFVLGNQVLVAAATVPLGFVAAAAFSSRQPGMVRVQREIHGNGRRLESDGRDAFGDETHAAVAGNPGDTVTVRTTVQNAGSETLVDCRVIDGVPEELPVVAGSPRSCVTLEPLETATFEYELTLQRGEYDFGEATVRTRDLTGTVAETWTVDVTGTETLRCRPTVEDVPVSGGTNDYAGEVPTDEGGTGVEFYSVREYELGDPVGAIDWRRYGRSRSLATVEYRAERATRIVCVVDARQSQFLRGRPDSPPAIECSADAADRAFDALVNAGHPTGVSGLYASSLETVPPGTDPETRARAEQLLETVRGPKRGRQLGLRSHTGTLAAQLRRTLPGEAQVFLFSSFVDDEPLELVERLRTRGYTVRVISPDVTDASDLATRLEALNRDGRLARARATGARVVDWDLDRPLGLVLSDALAEVNRR